MVTMRARPCLRSARDLRPVLTVLLISALLSACGVPAATSQPTPAGAQVQWGMVIHGGAGTISRSAMTPEREAMYRAALEAALRAGHGVLESGGSAMDATIAAIQVMENDSLFNAGRGAVMTNAGRHELDAAVADGTARRAGSVAGVTTVKNPILLARAVMDHSPHVFMIGEGAETFAAEQGLEIVPNAYFTTERARRSLERAQQAERQALAESHPSPVLAVVEDPEVSAGAYRIGTVGAVALDRNGRVAAATSTGGMTNKRWGRVGDVPVIGAGTYANPECAVSGTGWGEYFIRNTVARDICAWMEMGGLSLQAAGDHVIHDILPPQADDTGGIIAISRTGQAIWSFNTSGMYRGRIDQDGSFNISIYEDEQ